MDNCLTRIRKTPTMTDMKHFLSLIYDQADDWKDK